MTGRTVVAKVTPMNIVAAMTICATGRKLDRRSCDHSVSMTTVAIQAIVGAVERKVGLDVMIELPGEPVDRHMALGAIFAKPRLVHIVFEMTIDALLRRIQKRVGRMAVLTDDL